MYVCICHGVTERAVHQAAREGCRDLHELTMRTGCGASCGTCHAQAIAILAENQPPDPVASPPTAR